MILVTWRKRSYYFLQKESSKIRLIISYLQRIAIANGLTSMDLGWLRRKLQKFSIDKTEGTSEVFFLALSFFGSYSRTLPTDYQPTIPLLTNP